MRNDVKLSLYVNVPSKSKAAKGDAVWRGGILFTGGQIRVKG